MDTHQIDNFTYQNKVKSLKHELELIVTKMDDVCSSIKNVYAQLEELDKYQPLLSPSDNSQKPYEEPGNPHSQTILEKVGDGG
jgi:hypothetical protein